VRRLGKKRRGTVAVEMAVVSPVLFAILFGIIEFGWLFTVRHTLVNAAREGARAGSLEGVDTAEITDLVNDYLEPMGLNGRTTIAITEATDDDPTVTVDLSIPQEEVSLVGNFFGFDMGTIRGVAAMRKEGM